MHLCIKRFHSAQNLFQVKIFHAAPTKIVNWGFISVLELTVPTRHIRLRAHTTRLTLESTFLEDLGLPL